MKIYSFKNFFNPLSVTICVISLIYLNGDLSNAENLFEEMRINSSTKIEEDNSVIPTNPFEIVEMLRRYNSLNNATNPSDALDKALDSFNKLEEK